MQIPNLIANIFLKPQMILAERWNSHVPINVLLFQFVNNTIKSSHDLDLPSVHHRIKQKSLEWKTYKQTQSVTKLWTTLSLYAIQHFNNKYNSIMLTLTGFSSSWAMYGREENSARKLSGLHHGITTWTTLHKHVCVSF